MNAKTDSGNLDVLRACAVTFVLVFHLIRAFDIRVPLLGNLGHFGVLVFFVHTSLVLFFSLERQNERDGPELSKALEYARFMIRRVFRIYPASVLLVLFVWCLDLPMWAIKNGQFRGVHLGVPALLTNVFLVQNLTHTESVLAPVWSLPYEVQMYMALPFLFWAVRRMSILQVVTSWIAVAAACWLVPGSILALWDMPTYAPCFFAGMVAFRLSRSVRPRFSFGVWPIVIAAVTLLYAAYRTNHQGTRAGWICCFALGVSAPFFRELPRALRPPFEIVARYSYGIYLVHYVTIWFAFERLAWLSRAAQWVVFVLVTAGASALLYHGVERPLIRRGTKVANALGAARLSPHGAAPSE